MPTVSLTIPALPEHVRTARLVATAAARRCGLAEESLDDVRLAVGEACALAVVRNQAAAATRDILIELTDDAVSFVVTVHDQGESGESDVDDQLALALISAIVPDSSIHFEGAASTIRMSWPASVD